MIVYIAQSLDGYIADINNSVDWLEAYNEEILQTSPMFAKSYEEFIRTIDVVVQGANTYQFLVESGYGNPYQDLENYVITSKDYSDQTVTKFCTIAEFLKKDFTNKNVWIVGGAQVIEQLLTSKVVTKLIITQMPLILGGGIPLFTGTAQMNLTLEKVRYEANFLEMTYKVID